MRAPLLVTLPLALLLAAAPAVSRDLDQDEALRLRREGLIMPLEALLSDPDSTVAYYAEWALLQLNSTEKGQG